MADSTPTPTFVFDDEGKTYAYLDGKILASASDADELEAKIAEMGAPAPMGQAQQAQQAPPVCPSCGGQGCPQCQQQMAPPTMAATHVTTPNGVKGQILGKQKGLWGEQITIRLENGRIAKFDVVPELEYSTEKTASVESPYQKLEERLAAVPDGTKDSLVSRLKELKKIKREATDMIHGAAYLDQQTIHEMIVTADYEVHEVTDALAALEDAEPFAAPAPFSTGVAEQESVGGGNSSWLDHTLSDMIAEAEAQDFDKMMSEGPEAFVAETDTPALADAGTVRSMADSYVSSKTAGLDQEAVADFREKFLARVEEVRRAELVERKEKVAKEAKAQDTGEGPAEGIFW